MDARLIVSVAVALAAVATGQRRGGLMQTPLFDFYGDEGYRAQFIYMYWDEFVDSFREGNTGRVASVGGKSAADVCATEPQACRARSRIDLYQKEEIHLYIRPRTRCALDTVVDLHERVVVSETRFPRLRNLSITFNCMSRIRFTPPVERTIHPCNWLTLVGGFHKAFFHSVHIQVHNQCVLTKPVFSATHTTWLRMVPSANYTDTYEHVPMLGSHSCHDKMTIFKHGYWKAPPPLPAGAVAKKVNRVHAFGTVVLDPFVCLPSPTEWGCQYGLNGTTDADALAGCLASINCIEITNNRSFDALMPALLLRNVIDDEGPNDGMDTGAISMSHVGGNVGLGSVSANLYSNYYRSMRGKVGFMRATQGVQPFVIVEKCAAHNSEAARPMIRSFDKTALDAYYRSLYNLDDGRGSFSSDVNNEFAEATAQIINRRYDAYGNFFVNNEYLAPKRTVEAIRKAREHAERLEYNLETRARFHRIARYLPWYLVASAALFGVVAVLAVVNKQVYGRQPLDVWFKRADHAVDTSIAVSRRMLERTEARTD